MRSTTITTSSARYVRNIVLLAGLTTLVGLSVVMVIRGVDRVEVVAGVLYVAVFLGIVTVDVIGGVVAALAATAIYLLMRLDAIEVLGTRHFAVLVLGRLLGYLSFGLIGGFSWQLLRTRLEKLESFDGVDDDTLLLNSRAFADLIEREMGRSRRYRTSFSVAVTELPVSVFASLNRRKRLAVLRALGALLAEGVRTVDQVGVTFDHDRYRILVLLPETDAGGAKVFTARLIDRLSSHMLHVGVPLPRQINGLTMTFPGDAMELGSLRDDLMHLTTIKFPDARP